MNTIIRNKHMAAMLLTALCLTGCHENTNDSSGETAAEKNYDNLIFTEDFAVEQPDLQTLETFEMTINPDLSMQELYDLFDKTVEQYYPDTFSDADKELLYNVSGVDQNGESLPRTEYDDDGNPLIGGFAQSRDKLLSGELPTPWLTFNCDKGMIQMYPNGGLQSVTCDAAYQLDHPDGSFVGMYCAADENTVTDRIHIPIDGFESDLSYPLLNGETALTDAISFAEQYLQDSDKGIADEHLFADVTDAWIVDMGDGICGYHLWLTSTYNGIRIDTMPMKKGMGMNYDDAQCTHSYELYPGYAFMIESDRLDAIQIFGYRRAYQIGNIRQQETHLSYEEAVQKLSESLSAVSKIQISRAEFVYTPYCEDEMRKDDHLWVDAAWKFTAKNQNDGYDYVFYVDAVNGEVEYYKYW